MPEPTVLAIALATALALASLGGGWYEYTVVDPFWPRRPDLIQPGRGGISRRRFSAITESAARAWARRSLWRLPLDLVTCGAMLAAFATSA